MKQEFKFILIFNDIYVIFEVPKGIGKFDVGDPFWGKIGAEGERVDGGEAYR